MSDKVPVKKKRTYEELDKGSVDTTVEFNMKLGHFRDYCDNLRKIQDLELEILDLKKKNDVLNRTYPDLTQVQGIYDKWYKEEMVTVTTSDGRKRLFGSSVHDSKEIYEKKKAKIEENRKKNKEAAAKKKEHEGT